ncbi:MAG: hypothetical protein P1V20_32335 [Verrucomicrobiales bacterium]|nr:hypothetical protein [Verrucomicrobiales bacterium]
MADYLYSDGNGNVYHLNGLVLTYDPVETIESSSGTYCGGTSSKSEISEAQREALIEMFQAAFKNRTFRADTRNIGSAEIRRIEAEETFKVILAMRSPDKAKIEEYLEELR